MLIIQALIGLGLLILIGDSPRIQLAGTGIKHLRCGQDFLARGLLILIGVSPRIQRAGTGIKNLRCGRDLIARCRLILIVDSPRTKLAGEGIKPLSFTNSFRSLLCKFILEKKNLTEFFLYLSNQHHLLIIVCWATFIQHFWWNDFLNEIFEIAWYRCATLVELSSKKIKLLNWSGISLLQSRIFFLYCYFGFFNESLRKPLTS